LIEVQNVTKRYGKHIALDQVSFTVQEGEILGFLGPNGAGKSTTMNIITGYISASEGAVKVEGFDVLEHPQEVKKRIGYLPEFPPLYGEMTVKEYLRFACELKRMAPAQRASEIEKVAKLVQIDDVMGRLVRNLSKGYKQRVGLAQALIGEPPVLVLDEPTIGLDPNQIIEIRTLIKELGRKHTIVLSSHILPEVSAVCGRVLIINKGRIVASDTPANLSRRLLGRNRLTLRVAGPAQEVTAAVRDLDGVQKVKAMVAQEPNTCELLVDARENADIRVGLFSAMCARGYPILMMRPQDIDLEEVFLQLTTSEQDVRRAQEVR
jgi:ABC-2 type transport system ATP-binding protein